MSKPTYEELEAENARLREAIETWATDYAVQDKAFQATAQQRDELEAENARLQERLQDTQSHYKTALGYATLRAATIRQLEAENARLRGNYDMAIDALKYMRKQRNEARYWARRLKRQLERKT